MKWLRDHALNIFAGFAILYMLIPIGVIAVFSFNDPQGRYNFTWEGFTLDHWKDPFAIEELTDAMITSIQLAVVATIIATALGTLIAMALVRYEFFGRKTSNFLIVIPTATPEVVIGAALLSMFLLPPFVNFIDLGFQSLVIAHVMFSISFVVIVVRSRLIGFDRSLEEASRDLGAGAFTTFRTVTLPLLAPAIVAAGFLAFALSIDDFVISNFNSGTTVTFPLYIYGASQRGIPVEVNVLATMLFLLTAIAMGFTIWQQRRAENLASVGPDQDDGPGAPRAAALGISKG